LILPRLSLLSWGFVTPKAPLRQIEKYVGRGVQNELIRYRHVLALQGEYCRYVDQGTTKGARSEEGWAKPEVPVYIAQHNSKLKRLRTV